MLVMTLNLLQKSPDYDLEYDFQFLTPEEAKIRNEHYYWFPVGDILKIKEHDEVNEYLLENVFDKISGEQGRFASRTLFKLHRIVHEVECINYFLEKGEELDKVLNIFIRVNSGGTELSYSDLLLSIATAQWKDKDAREEISKFVDDINNIGDGFNVNKDFALKSCLVLNDFPDIAFKVDNFNKKNMLSIEKKWDDIKESIELAVALISNFGYSRDTLTSNNALIPIAYYILRKDNPTNFIESNRYKDDRKKIHKWLILSLLNRVFSGQPDNVLRPLRQIISESNLVFPLEKIIDKFRGDTKTLIFAEDQIVNLYSYQYGTSYTFSTLVLLYPTLDYRNKFHIDHIFPKSFFTRRILRKKGIQDEDVEFYLDNYNYLANLQLLEGIPNMEKSPRDFKEWITETYPDGNDRKEYMKKHYIPDVDLSIQNVRQFIEERIKLMTKQFKILLLS
ncbi:MAG: hypothetical protein ACRENZ_07730 [Thermodesulfobacteriota bacterium]